MKFFRDLFAQTSQYNHIGSYWEKDHQNEIDLVAINDIKKEIVSAEVKMNKKKVDLRLLKEKSKRLLADYPPYKVNFLGLSLEDTERFI